MILTYVDNIKDSGNVTKLFRFMWTEKKPPVAHLFLFKQTRRHMWYFLDKHFTQNKNRMNVRMFIKTDVYEGVRHLTK